MSISDKPLVSIIMVTYNHENFIADAIESVLASTYPHFELIIVDDRSKDNTYKIASSYKEKDSRVNVYLNENNLGDYPNRIKAGTYAKGYYMKYLDGDDMIYPNSLEIMVSAMQRYPEAALAIQQHLGDDTKPYPILANSEWVIKTHFLERGILNSGPSGTIFKTEVYNLLGGFSGEKFIGDSEMWTKMAFRFPVILLQPALVWWRIHPAQESKNEQKDKNMLLVRYKLSKGFLGSKECPISDADRKLALLKLNRRYLMSIGRVYGRKLDAFSFFSMLKKSGMSAGEFLNALIH